jgi:hypothetical protein
VASASAPPALMRGFNFACTSFDFRRVTSGNISRNTVSIASNTPRACLTCIERLAQPNEGALEAFEGGRVARQGQASDCRLPCASELIINGRVDGAPLVNLIPDVLLGERSCHELKRLHVLGAVLAHQSSIGIDAEKLLTAALELGLEGIAPF